jgi:asparagine synthase (glutamine-hydrolysing)
MCGIGGILGSDQHRESLIALSRRMGDALRHRGPDDSDVWLDPDASISLVHRRLSIVDLSPSGRQPMTSHDGRLVIVYNGELYNHKAIRAELHAARGTIQWRGHSDTEVLLEAIAHWGLEGALKRSVGMYALAVWDRSTRTLHLARDRAGEKPLYYGRVGSSFTFASELKGLAVHPDWSAEINRDAVALFMRHSYVPTPHSIFANIWKLPPASIVSISDPHGSLPKPRRYWSPLAAASNGIADPDLSDERVIADRLETLLAEAVRQQMQADVPLGAFLSGGVDSSTIVAMMQAIGSSEVKTFSIGFHEDEYDEGKYAKEVARHLGTKHTELYVTPEEAIAVVGLLPEIYDEPFGDSSQIPTFLVSRLARTTVTVSLSGDGGDELFGGYNRYFWGRDLWRAFRWIPPKARGFLAKSIGRVPPAFWDSLYHSLYPRSRPKRQKLVGDKLHKLADVMPAADPDAMYKLLTSTWKEPCELVLDATEPKSALSDSIGSVLSDPTHRMMLLDTMMYLPDDILVKLDRASMAVSLESRVPFLDHRLIEYAWRIPLSAKIDKNIGKIVLRNILYKYVPPHLIERPKQGFAVPIDSWLRGPLRDWAEDLLSEQRIRRDGFLDPIRVRDKWDEHQSGRRNWQYPLWTVLMFQHWLTDQGRRQVPTSASDVIANVA